MQKQRIKAAKKGGGKFALADEDGEHVALTHMGKSLSEAQDFSQVRALGPPPGPRACAPRAPRTARTARTARQRCLQQRPFHHHHHHTPAPRPPHHLTTATAPPATPAAPRPGRAG
jgi:hypothetical protein